MTEPTLDERIVAAQRDLMTATSYQERREAAHTLDRLNAVKLVGAIEQRDAQDRARFLADHPGALVGDVTGPEAVGGFTA